MRHLLIAYCYVNPAGAPAIPPYMDEWGVPHFCNSRLGTSGGQRRPGPRGGGWSCPALAGTPFPRAGCDPPRLVGSFTIPCVCQKPTTARPSPVTVFAGQLRGEVRPMPAGSPVTTRRVDPGPREVREPTLPYPGAGWPPFSRTRVVVLCASFIGPCRLDRDANVPKGPGDRRRRVSAAGTRG
jgi:hypothetical protein